MIFSQRPIPKDVTSTGKASSKKEIQIYMQTTRPLVYATVFAAFVFAVAHIGFYKKYIALFPSFTSVSMVTHFHATLMFLWLALLVLQPVLIFNRQQKAHRLIGKATYLIAPLLVISMILITNQGYISKAARMSATDAYASLSVNIPDFFAFSILYVLAVYFRKKSDWHARYMIATSFPIMGAAFVRVLMRNLEVPRNTAFDLVMFISEAVCIAFILADIKTKKYKPWLVTLLILVVEHLIYSGRYTEAWQGFAKFYVEEFVF